MVELQQPDGFIRFILWAGQRKRRFVSLFAAPCALTAILWSLWETFSVAPDASPLELTVIAAIFGFGGFVAGAGMGWFFWHLFVWPVYAAYPGSTILPSHIRAYDDSVISKPKEHDAA